MKKVRSTNLMLGKVIHDELKDIIECYPSIAPANTTGCFAVYRRLSLSCQNTKDIYNVLETANIEIAIISPSYSESLDKAINVKMYLEHLHGEFKTQNQQTINIQDITMYDCSEEWSNDNYIQILKFQIIMYNENE